MSVLPAKTQDLLDFCDAHVDVFSTNAAAIGLSPAQALLFKNSAGNARSSFNKAVAADQAKKAATNTSQMSIASLRKTAAETIALIKAFADNSATPSVVYDLAQVPMPAAPSPAPAPGTPTNFVVTLMQDGSVGLKWKCANPPGIGGTNYAIERKIGAGGSPFTLLGVEGKREFTDKSIPAGSSGVTYQITAFRSTVRGMPAQFNVNFGVSGDGVAFASVAPAMKLAA